MWQVKHNLTLLMNCNNKKVGMLDSLVNYVRMLTQCSGIAERNHRIIHYWHCPQCTSNQIMLSRHMEEATVLNIKRSKMSWRWELYLHSKLTYNKHIKSYKWESVVIFRNSVSIHIAAVTSVSFILTLVTYIHMYYICKKIYLMEVNRHGKVSLQLRSGG